MPDADRVTLEQIYDALVQGYNGAPVAGTKWKLTARHRPDDIKDVGDDDLPYLLFEIGTLSLSQWKVWEQYATWNIAATLKVKGEPGSVDKAFLRVIDALLLRTAEILGLPVDDSGKLVAYSQATATLFDQDKLTFLADRGAPVITSLQAQPSDGKYLTAAIQFAVQCVLDLDPRQLPIAKVGILGVMPSPSGIMSADSTLPASVGIPVITPSDEHAVTLGYDTPNPTGAAQAPQGVAGTPPQQQIRSVNVTPYSLALSSGAPTASLTAIATFANWASEYVTSVTTWSSSNASVATVDGSGNVTRVAAGTCTVSCSSLGVTSNAVAVTCS